MYALASSGLPDVLIIFCFCSCTSFWELCCSLCLKLQLSSCLFPFHSGFLNVTLSFPDYGVIHKKHQWAITDFIFGHQSLKLNSTKSVFKNLFSGIDLTKAKITFTRLLWNLSNLSLFFWSTSPKVEHRFSELVALWLHRREFVLWEAKPVPQKGTALEKKTQKNPAKLLFLKSIAVIFQHIWVQTTWIYYNCIMTRSINIVYYILLLFYGCHISEFKVFKINIQNTMKLNISWIFFHRDTAWTIKEMQISFKGLFKIGLHFWVSNRHLKSLKQSCPPFYLKQEQKTCVDQKSPLGIKPAASKPINEFHTSLLHSRIFKAMPETKRRWSTS